MSQQTEIRLSPCEREILDKIRRKMAVNQKIAFNVDDMFKWDLTKALYGVEGHKQGSFFKKLLLLGFVAEQNQVLGRYNRYIWNYRVIQ